LSVTDSGQAELPGQVEDTTQAAKRSPRTQIGDVVQPVQEIENNTLLDLEFWGFDFLADWQQPDQ